MERESREITADETTNMLSGGIGHLQNIVLSRGFRCWIKVQPHCDLWHSSSLYSKKTGSGNEESSSSSGNDSSSSSSDSDSDAERKGLDQKLKEAVDGVAKSIPGHGPKVQSDLLQQLQSFAKLTKDQASGTSSSESATRVSTLLSGMLVEKTRERRDKNVEDFSLRSSARLPRISPISINRENVKLFEGPRLGIFSTPNATQSTIAPEKVQDKPLSLWRKVQQEQLEMFNQQTPNNAFEEMIQWTKRGMLWKFPINNEQGLEEEAKVGFHEHVFLEDQIKDFPSRGPLRHFMELVLVGLSKNPYLSVQQKHEHIDWFRQYFKKKKDVLVEALGQDGLMSSASTSETKET